MAKKYKYRLLLDLMDRVVGVAVENPKKGLTLMLGNTTLEYEEAPPLAELHKYVEDLAAKKEYRYLRIDRIGKLREVDFGEFTTLEQLMQDGRE